MKPLLLCVALALFPMALPQAGANPMLRRQLMELPAEERQKYEVALETALASPEMASVLADRTAATEEFEAARRAAVLAKDDSLTGLLDKAAAAGKRDENGQLQPPLSKEERKKLTDAYVGVRAEPAVRSSQKKLGEVQKRYRETLNAALLKADPELGPVLEKLQPPKKEGEEGTAPETKPKTPAKPAAKS